MRPTKILSLLLVAGGFFGLYLLRDFAPVYRLLAASLGMIGVIKVAALLWQISDGARFRSLQGLCLFLFAWPGISVSGFTEKRGVPDSTGKRFLESWLAFLAGAAILLGASLIGQGDSLVCNYVALFAILLIIHLGWVEVIGDAIRLMGFSPSRLFDRPWLATSLRDFWSMRWNRAFVDMNKLFVLEPLRRAVPPRVLVFSIFVLSGILHEIGISYADGRSWGRPLGYFLLQGIGLELERKRKMPRALVWLWILLPLPLLFTPEFCGLFLGQLGRAISDYFRTSEGGDLFKYGLLIGGVGHLLVLCASVQVPSKLNWKEEFARLSPLNRKVFWTYGGYLFSIILFMSLVSFLLSQQTLASVGLPVLLWTVFIAIFWWARVLVDFFYMSHEDWPQGPLFTIGHICLSTLFIGTAALYSVLSLFIYGAIK